MPLPDLTAIQVKALEATRTCPDEYCIYDMDRGMPSSKKCGTCKGTGLVYVLDPDGEFGLRVECAGIEKEAEGPGYLQWITVHDDCCNNQGWTPSDNDFSWMWATVSAGFEYECRTFAGCYYAEVWRRRESRLDGTSERCGDSPDIFFMVLAQAVEAE